MAKHFSIGHVFADETERKAAKAVVHDVMLAAFSLIHAWTNPDKHPLTNGGRAESATQDFMQRSHLFKD